MSRIVKLRAVLLGILLLLTWMAYAIVVEVHPRRSHTQVAPAVAKQTGVALTARAFAHVSGGRLDLRRSLNVLSMAVLRCRTNLLVYCFRLRFPPKNAVVSPEPEASSQGTFGQAGATVRGTRVITVLGCRGDAAVKYGSTISPNIDSFYVEFN